jgi:hypothetical protein
MLEKKIGIANRGKRPNPSLQSKIMKYSKGEGIDNYSFSYKIPSVNQFAVLKNGWDLDYIDIVVFWTIFNFIGSGIAKKYTDNNNETWYWVSEYLIIKYLPLLPINSESSVVKRIANLCKYNLLERDPDNHKNCKKHLRIGSNSQLLLYTTKNDN